MSMTISSFSVSSFLLNNPITQFVIYLLKYAINTIIIPIVIEMNNTVMFIYEETKFYYYITKLYYIVFIPVAVVVVAVMMAKTFK